MVFLERILQTTTLRIILCFSEKKKFEISTSMYFVIAYMADIYVAISDCCTGTKYWTVPKYLMRIFTFRVPFTMLFRFKRRFTAIDFCNYYHTFLQMKKRLSVLWKNTANASDKHCKIATILSQALCKIILQCEPPKSCTTFAPHATRVTSCILDACKMDLPHTVNDFY